LPQSLIQEAYKCIGDLTPLEVDCGQLCNSICCTEWDEGVGMYLLPGEEARYPDTNGWYTIEAHSHSLYELCPAWPDPVYFLQCEGTCPREERPFACRVFPLEPTLANGELEVILSKEAATICPLAQSADISLLRSDFREGVRKAYQTLCRNKMMVKYISWLDKRAREAEREPWYRLFCP